MVRVPNENPRGHKASALAGLERALRRLRFVGAVLLVGAAVTSRVGIGDSEPALSPALAGLMCAMLLLANAASVWGQHRLADRFRTMVRFQLVADTLVTGFILWVMLPSSGAYLVVIASLPVLHGAIRYRLPGALMVWVAVAASVMLRLTIDWQPADGVGTIVAIIPPFAIALGLGIPAGHVADQLLEEIGSLDEAKGSADARSRLLAVLTIAGQDAAKATTRGELVQLAIEAATELGYDRVWVVQRRDGTRNILASTPDSDLSEAQDAESIRIGSSNEHYLIADGAGSAVQQQSDALRVLAANLSAKWVQIEQTVRLRRAMTRHRHEATHDQLTGLHNRRGLLEIFERLRTDRTGHREALAVLVLDLDGFKSINDTFGHDVGDVVLKEVGDRLSVVLSGAASVARFGGDEFVALVYLEGRDIAELTRQVSAIFTRPIAQVGDTVRIGGSIGIEPLDQHNFDLNQALRVADHSMYQAKTGLGRAA